MPHTTKPLRSRPPKCFGAIAAPLKGKNTKRTHFGSKLEENMEVTHSLILIFRSAKAIGADPGNPSRAHSNLRDSRVPKSLNAALGKKTHSRAA